MLPWAVVTLKENLPFVGNDDDDVRRLPQVAAPAGFAPTAVALCFSWAVLVAEALVVAECVARVAAARSLADAGGSDSGEIVGVASVASTVGGARARALVVALFAVLSTATAAHAFAASLHASARARARARLVSPPPVCFFLFESSLAPF